jgi:hypothetical protein
MSHLAAEREQAMLAELAEMDLALARKAHAAALAAETSDEIAGLSRAYQRLARSLRQTLALKAKLALDRERHERARQSTDLQEAVHYYGLRPHQLPPAPLVGVPAGAPAAAPLSPTEAAARRRDLTTALVRIAWDEAERAEGGRDLAAFGLSLEMIADALEETFHLGGPDAAHAAEPVDVEVARLAQLMEFDAHAAARWRDLPDPPPEAPQLQAAAWRSSA